MLLCYFRTNSLASLKEKKHLDKLRWSQINRINLLPLTNQWNPKKFLPVGSKPVFCSLFTIVSVLYPLWSCTLNQSEASFSIYTQVLAYVLCMGCVIWVAKQWGCWTPLPGGILPSSFQSLPWANRIKQLDLHELTRYLLLGRMKTRDERYGSEDGGWRDTSERTCGVNVCNFTRT